MSELCAYCAVELTTSKKCTPTQAHRDHVVPLVAGGTETVPACRTCNTSKGKQTPAAWVATLIYKQAAGISLPATGERVVDRFWSGGLEHADAQVVRVHLRLLVEREAAEVIRRERIVVDLTLAMGRIP